MRPLDFLGMAAVAGLLSWCAFDLWSRASDPYDINSRQRIAPAGGITGHGVTDAPKAQGVADDQPARELSALASPNSFPATSVAGPIATRTQTQEVKPAPGRIRTAPTKISSLQAREKRDGHSRVNQVGPVAQRIEQPRPKGKVAGSNPAWPAKLTKAQLAAEVRAALPNLPNAEVEAAVWIIWRESGGRTNAKNPRSSSHGLNGFLRSTWRNVTSRSGIRHGLDPRSQILAMHHYVTRRYGSFCRAKAHHVARRWY